MNYFRTIRMKFLLRQKLKTTKLFPIMLIHNFFSNLLPLRIGEFSFIYYVRKLKVKTGKALGCLFIARLFDFIAIIVLFFVSLLFIGKLPANNILIVFGIFLILAFLLLIFSTFYTRACLDRDGSSGSTGSHGARSRIPEVN